MAVRKQLPLSKKSLELIEKGKKYYLPVYEPREMVLDHGEGARLWDLENNEYIDLGAGIAVNVLGHKNEKILTTLLMQAKRLWHTSNIYYSQPTIELAELLVKNTFADRVFFCNSGAEANEAAIKIARKYSSLKHAPDKREIITFQGSFHGRTLATVTATAQPKYHQGFEPLPAGFVYCGFNDFKQFENLIGNKTCAVMIEPVQGEGGVTAVKKDFLKHIRKLCDKFSALLIVDEIQSGMGRTGKLFGYEWEAGLTPDIVTMAKALGGGLPFGAMLTTETVGKQFKLGDHGSTFGGNPVVATIAAEVLKSVLDPKLSKQVIKQGKNLVQKLTQINTKLGVFKEIRGRGLMVGAELNEKLTDQSRNISEASRLQGVLVLQAGPNVLRFLPPLNITDEELETGLERFEEALIGVLKSTQKKKS